MTTNKSRFSRIAVTVAAVTIGLGAGIGVASALSDTSTTSADSGAVAADTAAAAADTAVAADTADTTTPASSISDGATTPADSIADDGDGDGVGPGDGDGDADGDHGADGRGDRDPSLGGHTANGITEVVLTGDEAAKVTEAALAAVPGGTIERVETDAEGDAFEAHMVDADGNHITVKLDASYAVTSTDAGR
jgi:hypothetical protein